jgi:hypothetical protein
MYSTLHLHAHQLDVLVSALSVAPSQLLSSTERLNLERDTKVLDRLVLQPAQVVGEIMFVKP